MIEYVNLGTIVDVNRYSMTKDDALGCHITVDFFADDSVNFDRLQNDIAKLIAHPNNYILCDIADVTKARKEIASLTERVKRLECKLDDAKKESDKTIAELKKERDYWKDRFGSVVTDVSNVLSANGVEFTVEAIDGNKWKAGIDIPELNEAKKKISELEQKLRIAESRESYWRDRKEEEEDYHHYWLHTYNLAVAHAANKGVKIFMTGEDEENNVGVILVKNEKAEELEAKYNEKWSAMLQALNEKGVNVLYMGEEDGKPIIDVKIPAICDLKKELENLKSKTVAEIRYEWVSNSFNIVCTMCDGSKQTAGIDLSEPIDATSISCGTVPKCSSCSHFMHGPSRFAHDWRYMPHPKEGGAGYIRKLSKEETEGPACSEFVARKE